MSKNSIDILRENIELPECVVATMEQTYEKIKRDCLLQTEVLIDMDKNE